MSLANRITALESRLRAAPSSPMTAAALGLLTIAELCELEALLQDVDSVIDLPDEPRARVLSLIESANQRNQPASWPASNAPGYDVMASIRETYEATRSRLAQIGLKSDLP